MNCKSFKKRIVFPGSSPLIIKSKENIKGSLDLPKIHKSDSENGNFFYNLNFCKLPFYLVVEDSDRPNLAEKIQIFPSGIAKSTDFVKKSQTKIKLNLLTLNRSGHNLAEKQSFSTEKQTNPN